MEGNLMPPDRWMDKEDMAYRDNGILLSHKKEQNLAICDNMDRPRGSIMPREINQTEKDK